VGGQTNALRGRIFRFSKEDVSKYKGMAALTLFVINEASARNLRKRGEYLYKEMAHPITGQGTYAWKRDCHITEFIYRVTTSHRQQHSDVWAELLNSRGNVKALTEYLLQSFDPELPLLERDTSVTAWLEGLYFAEEDKFVTYEQARDQGLSVVAGKFFDQEFGYRPWTENWFHELGAEALKRILRDQSYTPEEMKFAMGMTGRFIYPGHKLDKLENVLVCKGIAGTGKSTWMRVIKHMFEAEDVGIFSNRMENIFGLQSYVRKHCCLGLEIKKDWNLNPALFQSMASQEEMLVPQKNRDPLEFVWKKCVGFACNELPRWADVADALLRRMCILPFNVVIEKKDSSIVQQVFEEFPQVYRLLNLCYHYMLGKIGNGDFWEHCPPKFILAKNEASSETNMFIRFITSENFEISSVVLADNLKDIEQANAEGRVPPPLMDPAEHKDWMIPETALTEMYTQFVRTSLSGSNAAADPFGPNLWRAPFGRMKIVEKKSSLPFNGEPCHKARRVFLGIRVSADNVLQQAHVNKNAGRL